MSTPPRGDEHIFPRLDLPYHEVGYWEAYGKAGPRELEVAVSEAVSFGMF